MSAASHTTSRALAGLLLAAPALATTWIVDDNGGPGVDFVNVQAAVVAAVDGDVIEVHDGTYFGMVIDGKSLVVRGLGPSVRINGPSQVKNVDVSRRVELVNLEFRSGSISRSAALVLTDNEGSVRLLHCDLRGHSSSDYDCHFADRPRDGLSADGNGDVTLLGCILRGGTPYYAYYCSHDGGSALSASQSNLTLLDCTLSGMTGGDASDDYYYPSGPTGGNGGHGLVLTDGSVALAHLTSFTSGGPGHGVCDLSCYGPSCGGAESLCPDGVPGQAVVLATGSTMSWKDSSFTTALPPGAQEVAIAPYCLGTYAACPCGNNGAGIAGCEHSFGLGGARLEGVGNASVSADTVTLQLTGLGTNGTPTALFFQGTTGSQGTSFNDGLLCAGGTIRRLKGKLAQNGAVSFGFGQPGDAAVSAAGNVPPAGATRFYQVWYRNNAAAFCTPLRFNMSNGVEIAWGP